ncbi:MULTISPECIES: HDIG domain-containing metalloprotein [Thermoanaerobacter]|uniref:Metal dependent phosphohydrolase n=1 Tax=Thermoanaerobacter italicus (strain DSM 9252 / Ab9) TaxID=580331 RepID=D3T7Y9_THEIA|nr:MULTISPECIES: HDIG domain-containing metalloprotein [Thermoanaerobacter]ADD02071.1 putative metal dependent phosphohydrolase [Thermoanaerobacter italicus Ab9]
MDRIKQYFKAKRAKIYEKDYKFLMNFLNDKELEYFKKLPVYEKRHSLDVCYYLIDKYGIKEHDLLKAAIFHDIGKIKAEITPFKKAIAVIFNKFPLLANFLERYFYFLKIYNNHTEYSAQICKEIGLNERIIDIVKHHHDKIPKDEDIIKLQEADERN